MAPKRPLGLGKAAKKKHKGAENGSASENNGTSSDVAVASELPKEKSPENSTEGADELTVELGAEIDANDAVGQLAALWRTYFVSEEKKELVLNGIIHECDRILRKANSEQRSDSDEENVDITEELFPDSVDLLFAKARIMINKIALTVISRLDKESRVSNKVPNGAQLLDECLAQWEKAEALTAKLQKYDYYNIESLDFLQALDDLLDVVDNFGHDRLEGKKICR
ncbi:hypothetical protein CJJ09_005625 [Candidozyma auris]|nr:hypothetical protein CJJ09_005625 [[Candida] auris]